MSIIRVSKNKKNPYFLMNKTGINDKRLSFKAKGLLAYLISKPDNWYINYHDLCSISINGIKSVRAAVKELTSIGYMVRSQMRKNDGKFTYYDFTVYEIPQHVGLSFYKSSPHSHFGHAVKGDAENSTPLINERKNIMKRATTSLGNKSSSLSSAADVPSWSKKETEAIRILNELKIYNCSKLFDLFDLPIILKYANWMKERKINIHNPTGFLIASIRESWDTFEPISYSSKLQSFTKQCILCDKEFTFEDYGDFHPFCPSCTYKE
ncbi:hypothetical protein ES707_20504 [subsurface metagenome]